VPAGVHQRASTSTGVAEMLLGVEVQQVPVQLSRVRASQLIEPVDQREAM